jgi:hypothetical protein
MNTYVHPAGRARLAKNAYGVDFHFLSSRTSSGISLALLGFAPTFTERAVVAKTETFVPLGRAL